VIHEIIWLIEKAMKEFICGFNFSWTESCYGSGVKALVHQSPALSPEKDVITGQE
jgi:hypothetical protein